MTIRVDKDVGAIFSGATDKLGSAFPKMLLEAANYGGGAIAEDCMSIIGSADIARSFLPAHFVHSDIGFAAGALSDHVAAGILNRGGTIRGGKTAKMLAIPISIKAKNMWPRDWPRGDLALIPSKSGGARGGGQALLIGAKEKQLTVHYVLMHEVEIDPRYYIDWAIEASKPKVRQIIAERTQEAVEAGMSEGARG